MSHALNKDFYAVTSFFNHSHTKERLNNYRMFKSKLSLPLVTVEWAPDGIFELNQNDSDILIQIKDGDIMWQKERLLNIAIESLPANAHYVAWVDCDIIFSDVNWHLKAKKILNDYDFVQLFEKVNYLPKILTSPDVIIKFESLKFDHQVYSITKILSEGGSLFNGQNNVWGKLQLNINGNPGMAFASKVDVIKKHWLYDKNIVGAGDLILTTSLFNKIEELYKNRDLSSEHRKDIQLWANNLQKEKYTVTYLPGDLYHLWHGKLENRNYAERWKILSTHEYSPLNSLKLNPSRTWSWNELNLALTENVRQYMQHKEIS